MSKRHHRRVKKTEISDCGDGRHQVVTLTSDAADDAWLFRREPCAECPWRKDSPIGAFPASAYRISANTAYDMADHTFACHMSGPQKPATCAGFLLRGAAHNLSVRLAIMAGRYSARDVPESEIPLYEDYVGMAVANGVDPDDEALVLCRSARQDHSRRYRGR